MLETLISIFCFPKNFREHLRPEWCWGSHQSPDRGIEEKKGGGRSDQERREEETQTEVKGAGDGPQETDWGMSCVIV